MAEMQNFEVHVAQVATNSQELFLYTHYLDSGHRPYLTVIPPSDSHPYIRLECQDTFKLKPNVQGAPKNRIDLYTAYGEAAALSLALEHVAGCKVMPQEAQVDPERSRRGQKSLPKIPSKTYRISDIVAGAQIARASTFSFHSTLYIEIEGPNPDHGVMEEDEPHIGIAFGRDVQLNDAIDECRVKLVNVPENELKVKGEKNPVRKSKGMIRIQLTSEQAGMLSKAIELLLAAYEPNAL